MQKRQADDFQGGDVKKSRVENIYDEDEVPSNHEQSLELVTVSSSAMIVKEGGNGSLGHNRTSNLSAPNMMLSGHGAAVYSLAFSPSGDSLASAGMEGKILLWDVYGECKNFNVLDGHKSAILQLQWNTENKIISASADKSVALWDANSGNRIRKLTTHTSIVNCCTASVSAASIFASGSDDCTAILFDTRDKLPINTLYHDYQILSASLSSDGLSLFTGGIDNIVRKWDLRATGKEPTAVLSLTGHMDSVTGLSISPDGNHLLSNAMDQSMRKWDVRPFASNAQDRCEMIYQGSTCGAEKGLLRCSWSPDGEKVACGSADRHVRIWDAVDGHVLYLLPGHKGSVNDIIFHPKEPIIASCGTDREIFLGELI